MPPPVLVDGHYADAPPVRPNDWSGLAIPAAPTALDTTVISDFGNADDDGLRRQPELSESITYDPAPAIDR